ncbi:MAG: DEAD/DEAH box helicase [Nitrosomonas sp.]|nr:DEAD/DEAH box helicase [Nitrosomonas sp.]
MSSEITFAQLGLSVEILQAVADEGYVTPTAIQAEAVPVILAGRDVMASAQTGTGKTAGYTLPLLNRLQAFANTSVSPAKHPVRALIMAPTRELAIQIDESVRKYGKYLPLKVAAIYGGVSMPPQTQILRNGVEILVATPGRLLDHVEQKVVNFSKTEILVLDEADRMLDMGFLPDIKRVMALLPGQRQSLLFSATFSVEIRKLADSLLKNPIKIEVSRKNTVNESISHVVHLVRSADKLKLLVHLIRQSELTQALIFVKTKQSAGKLATLLAQHDISALAIHGDKNQQQRTQALEAFKLGEIEALVATDVAARGLDIDKLSHVINFELPGTPEDYIHRIGRTGRAGSKGKAISLVSEHEKELLVNIERLLNAKLELMDVPGFVADIPVTGSPSQGKKIVAPHHSPARKPSLQSKQDPIFTQPYTPGGMVAPTISAEAGGDDSYKSILPYKKQQDTESLPVLFKVPVRDKKS